MRYRSKFEAAVAADLIERGVAPNHESERIAYSAPRIYIPDFVVRTRSGKKIYVEAKGYFPREDRRKMLDVISGNPELDIRLVFQNPNQRVGTVRLYRHWADQHDIPWAAKAVPQEWLDE